MFNGSWDRAAADRSRTGARGRRKPACDTGLMALRRLYLTEDKQLQFIVDAHKAMVLECFLGRESTVSEAVAFKERRSSRARFAYWVKKLLEIGLIEQVGTRREGSRTVPVYRCVADELVVTGPAAYRLTTQPGGIRRMQQKMLTWLQTTAALHIERLGDDFVMKHFRPDESGVVSQFMPRWELEGEAARAEFVLQDDWLRLRLPRAAAREFIRELEDLSRRIRAASLDASDEAHPFYIGHLALVEDLD